MTPPAVSATSEATAVAKALGKKLIIQGVKKSHNGWAECRRVGQSAPTPAPPGMPEHAEDRQWRDDGR